MIENKNLESDIISIILLNQNSLEYTLSQLIEDDFFDTHNKVLFQTIQGQYKKNIKIDATTVKNDLKNPLYETLLLRIFETTASPSNIKEYCKQLKSLTIRRNIRKAALEIQDFSEFENDENIVIETAESTLYKACKDLTVIQSYSSKEIVFETLKQIEKAGNGERGISTGLKAIDNFIDWFEGGCSYLLAARPGVGKTAFALELIERIASQGIPLFIFSMEMSRKALYKRVFSKRTRIHGKALKFGDLTDKQSQKLQEEAEKLATLPIWVDDKTNQTIESIYSKVRAEVRKNKIQMVFIDHVGFIRTREKKENRIQEMKIISQTIKAISKDFNIPVLTICPLNRNSEKASDKRPQLADLKESGDLESDADCVIMLYRDEIYNPESLDKGIMEVIFRKQREGPLGTEKVFFNPEIMYFDDIQSHGENHENF